MKKLIFCSLALCLIGTVGCKKESAKELAQDQENVVQLEEQGGELPEENVSNLYKVDHNMFIPEGVPMVVDFYADWCVPCKQYAPVFHEAETKYAGQVIFLSVNIEDEPEIAKAYGVSSIPNTTFILPGGAVMGSQEGAMDLARLSAFINQLIATNDGDDLSI